MSARAFLWPLVLVLSLTALVAGLATLRASLTSKAPPASVVTSRPTPSLLIAVRDIARLETTQVHVEKVIDLTDTQSRFFGLVQTTDAILLVAVGHATVGIDLSKLGDGDVFMDHITRTMTLRLPAPELLGVSLDEKATYVYTRSTSPLARRNEGLEGQARREAVAAIEKAATDPEVHKRAKDQAERELRALLRELGAESVLVVWP